MSGIVASQDHLSELAEFIKRVSYEDIPSRLSRKILLHILDTLAVGLLGADTALSKKCRKALPTHSSRLASYSTPLWGSEMWADPSVSAFCNGVSAHVLELDDSHGCDHSGAVVVPAALAASGCDTSTNLKELV